MKRTPAIILLVTALLAGVIYFFLPIPRPIHAKASATLTTQAYLWQRSWADSVKTARLSVTASGATSLKIDDLDAKELVVSGSGAMKIDLKGRATVQRVGISGAGDYRAADLVSDDARVGVSGAGRVVIHAEKTLRIGISGAGSVEYYGDPQVTQQISGAGRVKRHDAAEVGRVVANRPVTADSLVVATAH